MNTNAPVAEVRGASKAYGTVIALSEVDLSISEGEVRALLGKNGAGKSTLIKLLAGAELPDVGEVLLGGEALGERGVDGAHALGVRTVYQELSLIGSMTVAENMFMGHWPKKNGSIDHRKMNSETRKALAALGLRIDPNRNVEALSVADQQMVEIARAVYEKPRLLILDEPTSSLAADEVERVLETVRKISATGVAVVYVSHRLGEIRRIANTASVMRDGRLIDTRSLAEVDTSEVVRMMIGNTVDAVQPVAIAEGQDTTIVVDVADVHSEPYLHGVTLQLHKGEVLGIAGVLGSGRTELLRIIAALDAPESGTVIVNGLDITGAGFITAKRNGVGLTPENRKEDGIFPFLGVDENMVVSEWSSVSTLALLSPARISAAAKSLISRLSIKVGSPQTEISTLSGGNQQKAVIGRWLHANSNILLMDEPTRGVDVEAKAQIYALVRQLAAGGKSVIFVSSEIEELPSACDRVIVLRGGVIVEEHRAPNVSIDTLLASAIAEH